MKIRKAKKKDLKKIVELYKKVYSEKPYNETWPDKYLIPKVNEMLHWMSAYVAEVKGEIVGFIFFYDYKWHEGKRGYLEDLGVLKEFRGEGIASKLIKKVEGILRKRKVRIIKLNVTTKAKGALRLYQKIGYKKTHEIKMEKKLK